MSKWTDPEEWRKLRGGEACPICVEGKPYGIVAELEAGYVTTQPDHPSTGTVAYGSNVTPPSSTIWKTQRPPR